MLFPLVKRFMMVAAFGSGLSMICFFSHSYAQAPPITSSGLNTQVSAPINLPNGTVQFDITGGTRPHGGTNLFHSFGDFNVPTSNIANFLNSGSIDAAGHPLAAGLPTSNILGRVTAGNPSVILGMIQTNGLGGFGNANLFLMNPAGFLFGPNVTVNVGGMVAFTTADYLRFQGSDTLFNKVSTSGSLSPLSIAPVATFGFIGATPGAIAIQGGKLQVAQDQSLSLVGGNKGFTASDPDNGNPIHVPDGVTMTGGKLSAPGGQINIVSVAGPGQIAAADFLPTPGMTMGDIKLAQGTVLDVSADAAGTVRIRGGQLVMDNATISADTGAINGAPVAVDIALTGDLSISSDQAPAITSRATDAGNAGEIRLTGSRLNVSFGFAEFIALIDSHTAGTGNAGAITLAADELTAALTDPSLTGVFIHSGTGGAGNGGNVTIKVERGELRTASVYTGDSLLSGTGSAGSLSMTGLHGMADSLLIDGGLLGANLDTSSLNAKGGAITLEAHDMQIRNSANIGNSSLLGDNPITIKADRLIMDNQVLIESSTILGEGGGITFTGNILEFTNGSTFLSQTFGDGPAGPIRINAAERVLVADDASSPFPSGVFTNSFGGFGLGSRGNGGAITVTTKILDIRGGALFNATTDSGGNGGDIFVNATQGVSISGEFHSEPATVFIGLGSTRASGIYTRTVGSEFCGGPCGNGGDTTINTGSLSLLNGAVLNNGTANSGHAGKITVNATDQIAISGNLSDGRQGGIFSRSIGNDPDAGAGSNIALTAGQSVTISDGASVSASSTGPGNAGNISINAGQQFEMHGSSITTTATKSSGGNIDIQAIDRVRLVNSSISTSVLGGAGGGGNITIDPNVVALQNSQVIAQAVQGAGGNITITTPSFFADSSSHVSASSQFGRNGTVTIQSPTSNLSESLGTLPSDPSQAHSLVTQRCAALTNGQTSSFVVAGREQLPADPGGWLTSPLAFAALNENLDAGHAVAYAPAVMPIAAHDTGTVSLRRLTPAGFLMASFAESGATGCHS